MLGKADRSLKVKLKTGIVNFRGEKKKDEEKEVEECQGRQT